MENLEDKNAEIWAVGGGKGGTGKTFLVSQLAVYLASKGKQVILIDTDFGGANIHSFFNIKGNQKTINSFFEDKELLENLVIESGTEKLGIIHGDSHAIDPGNLNYTQKMKLFRHIKRLKADYILLDLGGGTNNDVIDAFLLADRKIVMAIPEITAIENLFQFVKKAYFRKLKFLLSIYGLKESFKEIWINRKKHNIKSIVDLVQYIKKSSDSIHSILNKELSDFSFYVVLNKVRNAMEIQEGFSIRSVCIKHIGIETLYAGYIEYDFQFWKNLSLIQATPRLNVSHSVKKDIMRIAENIIASDQMKINSIKSV